MLRAGFKLAVLDASDQDWWRGEALGGVGVVGFFPSSYVTRLQPGEKPLQVVQALQLPGGGLDGPINLLRDQVKEKGQIGVDGIAK